MNLAFARAAWRTAMPKPEVLPSPKRPAGTTAGFKGSKTTIIALRTHDGVVMGADRRCTAGYSLINEDEIKIDSITADSALASCGSVASSQYIVDQLRVQARKFENTTGMQLSLRGLVRMAGELCRNTYDGGEWFSFGGLLAGFDAYEKPFIFEIEETGGRVQFHRFVAIGSGGPSAMTTLRLLWRPDMRTKDALILTVKALYMAGLDNVGTSDLRMTVPMLASIQPGRRGFAFATERVARRIRDRVQREMEGIR